MSAGQGATQTAGAVDLLVEALRIGAYALAAMIVLLGVWLLWGQRGEEAVERRTGRTVRTKWWFTAIDAWGRRLTMPTRMTFALTSLLLGYHLAAWTAPGHVLPFRIPLDLWFLLVGGGVLACVASLWMDRRQAADDPSQTK